MMALTVYPSVARTGCFCLAPPTLIQRPWLRRWGCTAFAQGEHSGTDVASLLERQWLLKDPAAPVSWVREGGARFAVVRDDLTHPLLGGNKFRKLDGLWPELQQATDVVTCGGLQSAHTTAVAAACAEHGIRAHLYCRGERPAVPTGHHLYTRMLGNVVYVSRAEYADREGMLSRYAQQLEAQGGGSQSSPRRVAVIPEGAAQPEALLGTLRLVRWLATQSELEGHECHLVVDSGTGATATGLALGAALCGLSWRVSGIMLAGSLDYYTQQQQTLVESFAAQYTPSRSASALQQQVGAALQWVGRAVPRKFGKVLPGEIERCREVAQQHGILVDPIWTLASWEAAQQLAASAGAAGSTVVMLHTGGMLGLCGLAQRYPDQF